MEASAPPANVIVVQEINSKRIVGIYTNQEDADRKAGERRGYVTEEFPLSGTQPEQAPAAATADTPPFAIYIQDQLIEGLRTLGPAKVQEIVGFAIEAWLAAYHQVGGSEPPQPTYPYNEGDDILVLGPQIFLTHGGGDEVVVINYRGENFVPQPEPDADAVISQPQSDDPA